VTGRRTPQIVMLASFLAIITAVPVGQAVVELRQGRKVQAFDLFTQTPTVASARV
jgi:hypothetical protein